MKRKIPSSGFKSAKARDKTGATRELETTVTFLRMDAEPVLHIMPPANIKLSLIHVLDPTISYYRYLYHEVGKDYHWVDRKALDDGALARIINHKNVSLYVAYCAGNPAGFFELDESNREQTWLAYFGLLPEFHGMGIGKWLLSQAIKTAWATSPPALHVETCTLDAPHALALYQKLGFRPYERKDKIMVVPAEDDT